MSRRAPRLRTDDEAEKFLNQDLSGYLDPAGLVPLRFEFEAKNKSVNLRLSKGLLDAVRAQAERAGIPYQRFIRMTLERAVQPQNDSRK